MNRSLNIAIVGATGVVGRLFLDLLGESDLPIANIYCLASERSQGKSLPYKDTALSVQNIDEMDFSKADMAFFTAGAEVSKKYAPKAVVAGCVVVDNTSAFRYEDDVPLVIPEINAEKIKDYKARYIVSNPNCSTMQLLLALKPIYDAVGIRRVICSTYQAVSGAGQAAIDELTAQTEAVISQLPIKPHVFSHQIAFNVIPFIDELNSNGYTKEEMKMHWETKKILDDDQIEVSATAVRVPVINGHSESVTVETRSKLMPEEAVKLIDQSAGVKCFSELDQFPTPLDVAGQNDVVVGRMREDLAFENGLSFWVVGDNLRKGAALNALQIMAKLYQMMD